MLDDTLIYYITGDNGAPAEGQPNGTFSEVLIANGLATLETSEYLASKIDEWGGPTAFNHNSIGWAHATNTPHQWTKQVASHWGGTRNGTIVHWLFDVMADPALEFGRWQRTYAGYAIEHEPARSVSSPVRRENFILAG